MDPKLEATNLTWNIIARLKLPSITTNYTLIFDMIYYRLSKLYTAGRRDEQNNVDWEIDNNGFVYFVDQD